EQERRRTEVEHADEILVGPADVADEHAADVDEVERHQSAEDEDLRPLRRFATKSAEVLDDEQARLRIEEEKQALEDAVDPERAVTPAEGAAGGEAVVAATIEPASRPGRGDVEEEPIAPDEAEIVQGALQVAAPRRLEPARDPVARRERVAGKVEARDEALHRVAVP